MGELTTFERAQRALALRTSRRGFLGRVGKGVVALAGGSLVATALAPERAEAHHICGHTYTTGSCPHPYAPLSRTDRYGFPVHPTYGYPVDDQGEIYTDPGDPGSIQDLRADRSGGLPLREQPALRRRVDPVLRRAATAHPGLLFSIEHPHQRGLRRARILPRGAQGLLHHLSGAHENVLIDPGVVLAIAAAVAGWSALWGP